MDYDQIIQKYRTNYSHLAEAATLGSNERYAYEQIVQKIDEALARVALDPQNNTPSQRSFEVAILLKALPQITSGQQARQIVKKCADDFSRETGLNNDFSVHVNFV